MLFFFDDKKPFYYNKDTRVAFQIGGFYTGQTCSTKDKIFQFIQSTSKGYNFLDIKTGRCLYTKPLYVSKADLNKCQKDVRYFDLRFRGYSVPALSLLIPLAVSELSDVLSKIETRQQERYDSMLAKKRNRTH